MGILDWLFRRSGRAVSAQDRQRIDEAVERVVEITNPRLRFARRYRARLAPAVETALAYARKVVAAVPAAREASAAAWASDPNIHVFFATADDLVRAFSRSTDLRAHFDRDPAAQEAHAVLGMEMIERRILGMAMQGETVQRDVAQTTVSFGDHKARICGRSEAELRTEIERRMLDQLALEGLARAAADQSQRAALEQERALLKVRFKLLERQGAGMRAALGGEAVGQSELARLQSQLEENSQGLRSLGEGSQLLESELERLREVLADPGQYFYVTSKRLRLDGMNVVLEDNAQGGTEFEFLVARVPGDTPQMRAFALVRFPRAGLLPAGRLGDEAARLLV